MKQIYSLFTVLFLLSILLFSCSEENEEGCDIIKSAENNKYSVVIDSGSSAESRAITDLVQGGGNYSEGSLVKLYTKDRKFMATAVGSAGTTWLQNGDPNSTTILTSSINQDWSVAIKYYSDVILDCTAPGGDGSKVTKTLEVGSQLPDPVVTAGYTFEGWYEGGTRVYIVPESSNRTITGKFTAAGFIIVGDDGYVISPSGTQKIGISTWNAITYGNGKYVAIGCNSLGITTTSTDGVTWTTPNSNGLTSTGWKCIIYGDGLYVAASTDGYVSTSTNGLTWSMTKQIGYGWQSIAHGPGKFVLLSETGNIATSSDGINWENKRQFYDANWYAITKSTDYVAVGQGSSTSYDAISWTTPIISNYKWRSIVFGKGQYVAVGDGGYITTSRDGISWTTPQKVGTVGWKSIICKDRYIVVGENGYFITSKNGTNWTIPEQVKDDSGRVLSINLNDACAIQ